MHAEFKGIKFTDADIVNQDDYAYGVYSTPSRVKHAFLFHDHGFALAVVFADNLQDALDIAADSEGDKLGRYRVSDSDLSDYGEDGEGLTYLGNASESFDIESLSVEEMPVPPFSFVALFNAQK